MRAAFEHVRGLAKDALNAPGDFAEFGLWRGDTFIPLARLAVSAGRQAHGIDSFEGMAEPTAKDFDAFGKCAYPKGALAAAPDTESRIKASLQAVLPSINIWRGFIPKVFSQMPDDLRFAFAHVDLDQYAPTLATLRWVWPRISPGGIMCCHDYFDGRTFLAGGAIDDWMGQRKIEPAGRLPSNHIWFEKKE